MCDIILRKEVFAACTATLAARTRERAHVRPKIFMKYCFYSLEVYIFFGVDLALLLYFDRPW